MVAFCWSGFTALACDGNAEERPNILIVTVDDMSCDSVGVYGCQLPGTTPHMDRLAKQGMKFAHAHMQVGNCMPGRNVLLSGRFPHTNRVEGFYQVKDAPHPHLCDLMKKAGYYSAIRGKVSHSTPYIPYAWDDNLDTIDGKAQNKKDPVSFYTSVKRGIENSEKAEKPFFLLVNISDPHKPFYSGKKDKFQPSKTYGPSDVPIPGYLFDHPAVRKELALYYSSVRRADDCLGQILKALEESGKADQTMVTFLSDHGMPLPFAKTQLYYHSTRTPWIVKWPKHVAANSTNDSHLISAVDLVPTILDVVGAEHPKGLEGRSFKPLIAGEKQTGREFVFLEYNENAGGNRHPIRGVTSRRFGYLFNPWSDGERKFRTATQGTATYRTMKELAKTDKKIAARLELFDHRVREEFFDYQKDPDALHNLIDDPNYQDEIDRHRKALADWMERTGDHAKAAFLQRDQESVVQAYMTEVEAESAARRAKRNKKKKTNQGGGNQGGGNQGGGNKFRNLLGLRKDRTLIKLELPAKISPGDRVVLQISHKFPERLGSQKIHATFKDSAGKRLSRKVISVKGEGSAKVEFLLPDDFSKESVTFAAFVGEDYQSNLQHVYSKPLKVSSE